MASMNPIHSLFSRLSLGSTMASRTGITPTNHFLKAPATCTAARLLHATPSLSKSKPKRKGAVKADARITNIKRSTPRAVPAPLRFGRNRALRHWTIHRAWLLYQRKEGAAREKELERMYQSMHNACEELRKTSGPGTKDEGYLYRVAIEKKGLYKNGSIPIDYARLQTETPPRKPWDHEWTR